MFADEYSAEVRNELKKSLRLMPHYQNTGGFYIAVIEKIAECGDAVPVIREAPLEVVETKMPMIIQEKPTRKDFDFYRCDRNDPDVEYLRAYYGLEEAFPCH